MDDAHLKATEKSKYLAKLKKLLAAKERKLERCLRAERSKAHVRRKIKEHSLIAAKEREGKHTHNDSNISSASQNENQSNSCAKQVVVSVVSENKDVRSRGKKERKNVAISDKFSKEQSQSSTSTIASSLDKNRRLEVIKESKSSNICVNNSLADPHLRSLSTIALCKNGDGNIVSDNLKSAIQCDSKQTVDKDPYVSKGSKIRESSLCQKSVNILRENSALLNNDISFIGHVDGNTSYNDTNNFPQSQSNIGRNSTKSSPSKTHSQLSEIVPNEVYEKRNHSFNNSEDATLKTGTLRKLKTKRKRNQYSDRTQNLEKITSREKSQLLLNSDRSELASSVSDSIHPSDNVQQNVINRISSQRENTPQELKADKSFCKKDTEHRIGNNFSKDEQTDKGLVKKDSLSLCGDDVEENTEEKVEDSENDCSEGLAKKTVRRNALIGKVGSEEKFTQPKPSTPTSLNSISVELTTNPVETRKDSDLESPVSYSCMPIVVNSVNEKLNDISKESQSNDGHDATLTCSAEMKHKTIVRGQDSKLRRSRSSTPKSSSASHSCLKIQPSDSSSHRISSSSKDILDLDSSIWESQISKNHTLKTGKEDYLLNQLESTSKCLLSISDEDKILECEKTLKEFNHPVPESPPDLPVNNASHPLNKTSFESGLFERNQASIISNSQTSSDPQRNPGKEAECENNTLGNYPDPENNFPSGNTDKTITPEQNQMNACKENSSDSLKTSEPVSTSKKIQSENIGNLMQINSNKSNLQYENLEHSPSNNVREMQTDPDDKIPTLGENRQREEMDVPKLKDGPASNSSQIDEDTNNQKIDADLSCNGKEDDAHLKTEEVLEEEVDSSKISGHDDENYSKETPPPAITSSVKRRTCFKRIRKGNAKKDRKETLQDTEMNTKVNVIETLRKDESPVSSVNNESPVSSVNNSKDSDIDTNQVINNNMVSVTNEHSASDVKIVKEKKRKFQYPSIPDRLKISPHGTPVISSVKQRIFMKPKVLRKQPMFEAVQEQVDVTADNPKMQEEVSAVVPENLESKKEPRADYFEKMVDQESKLDNHNPDCTTRLCHNLVVTDIPKEANDDSCLGEHSAEVNSESRRTVRIILPSAQNLKDPNQYGPEEICQNSNTNKDKMIETSDPHVIYRKPILSNIRQETDDYTETSNLEESLISDKVSSKKSIFENNPVTDCGTLSENCIDEAKAKSAEHVELKNGSAPSEAQETADVDAVFEEMLFDTCNFDDVESSQHKKATQTESRSSTLKSPVNHKAASSHPVIDDILLAPENFDDIDIVDPMNLHCSQRSVEKHSNAGDQLESSLKTKDTNVQTTKIVTPKFVSFCPASKISSTSGSVSEQSENCNEKTCMTSITDNLSLENELEEILNKRGKTSESKMVMQRGSIFHSPKLNTSIEDNLEAILTKGKLPKSFPNFKPASLRTPSSLNLEDQFEEILKKKKPQTDVNISLRQNLSTPKCETSLEDELESMLMKRKECSVSRSTSICGISCQSAKQEMNRPTFKDKISLDKKFSAPKLAPALEDEFESVLMKRKVASDVDISFRSAKQQISNIKNHTNAECKSIPQTNAQKCLSKLEKDLDDILNNKTSSAVKMTPQRSKVGSSNLEDELEAIIKNGGKKPVQPNMIQKGGFSSAKLEVANPKSSIEDEFEEMLKKRSNVTPKASFSKEFQTPRCPSRNTSLSKTNENNPESPLSSKLDLKSFMSRPRRSNSFIPVTPKAEMRPATTDESPSQNCLTTKLATPLSSNNVLTLDMSTPKCELNYQSPQIGKIQMFSKRKQGSPYIPVVPKNRTPLITKEPISEISSSKITFNVKTSTKSKNDTKSSISSNAEPHSRLPMSDSLNINSKDEKNSSSERDFDPMHNSEMMFVLSDANDFDDQDMKEEILTEKNSDKHPELKPINTNPSQFSKDEEKISSEEAKVCLPSFDQNLDQVHESNDRTNIHHLSVSKDDRKPSTPSSTPKSSRFKETTNNSKRRSIYESFYNGLHSHEKSKDQCKQVIGFKVSKTPVQGEKIPDLKSSHPVEKMSNISERGSVAPKPLMSGPRRDLKPLTSSPPSKLEHGKTTFSSPFVNNQKRRQPFIKVPLISHEDESKSITAIESGKNALMWRRKFNTRKRNLENLEDCSRLSQESDKKRLKTEEDAGLISDSQMEKIFCTSFDMSVNQEEDSVQEDSSRIYTDHQEPRVQSERYFDTKEQGIATKNFTSNHDDIPGDVGHLKVNLINPNKLTEIMVSTVDSKEIIHEEERSLNEELQMKQEKNAECIEYSKYTELDVLDYSQFEFSEDFLSTENSDTKNPRKRKRGHIGNAIQRRSPRICNAVNSSICSQSVEVTDSQRTRRKKYISKAETCLIISSVFQYLMDEVKRNREESDFCLPVDNFKELISVKLSSHNDKLNTKAEHSLEPSIPDLLDRKTAQKSSDENVSEKEMHIKVKDEPKSFRVSPTSFLDSQAAHKQKEIGDDSLSEPMCYHRNDALDSQQLEMSVVAETDQDKTNMSSNSNSSKTLNKNLGDEISKSKKSAKVNLMLDKLECTGRNDLDAKVLSDKLQQETFIETDHEVSLELFEDGLPDEENMASSLLELKNTSDQDHALATLSFEKADFFGEKDGSYLLPHVDTPKEKMSRKMSVRSIKGLSKFIGTIVGSLGTQKSSAQTVDFTSSLSALNLDKHELSPKADQCYLNTQIKDFLTESFETEAVDSRKLSQFQNQDTTDNRISMKTTVGEENLESLLNSNIDTAKENSQFRSDLSDQCKKDLDRLFGDEEEEKTDLDEEEFVSEEIKHNTPKFCCSSKTKLALSCATSTPKIPKISKTQRDTMSTPKDSNIRRAFCLSPLPFPSQTTPLGKGSGPQIKGRLFDDSGLSLDMSSRPCDLDDDEDGVLPIECLKLTREENVVYVNGGQYLFNGSVQDYIVCILPTTISVWTKGNGEEWENELEWFLSPNYQATCGWSLKKENHVIMLTMEENKDGDQKLSLFFYDLTSGESNMAAINVEHENDSPVTNILCCALDNAVIICSNHPTTFSASKYILTHDSKHLTLCCHLEASAGNLIDMQVGCHLDKCIMGLTGEGEAVLWNHETGRISKRIDLCSGVLSDVSLTAVRNVKDGLLFHLMYRIKETTPGFSLLVNSEKEMSFIQHDYQSLQYSWKGLKSMKAMEDTLIAVDFCGNMGLWEIDSGKLLAALVKSDVTCVGFSESSNKLIYFGLKTGVVHVYSLQQ